MDSTNPPYGNGLHCHVTGTVVGNPLNQMVKNGTVPMLGMTLAYSEYDGNSSYCRVTLFGNQAQALANRIRRGQTITAEGTVRLNSWEKSGETKHGLSMLASRVKVEDGSGEGTRHFPTPKRIAPPVEDNGADMF